MSCQQAIKAYNSCSYCLFEDGNRPKAIAAISFHNKQANGKELVHSLCYEEIWLAVNVTQHVDGIGWGYVMKYTINGLELKDHHQQKRDRVKQTYILFSKVLKYVINKNLMAKINSKSELIAEGIRMRRLFKGDN
jgi:hypothetical protein